VKTLADFMKSHEVFGRDKVNLINIVNGDMASDDIAQDLIDARESGVHAIQDFIKERLTDRNKSFYDSVCKLQLKTFDSLYKIKVPKDKESKASLVKADRDLFRRVLLALESGREVDVNNILEQEISAVPLSLATFDGKLRSCTKSQLLHILEQGFAVKHIDNRGRKVSYIIDAMGLVRCVDVTGMETFGASLH